MKVILVFIVFAHVGQTLTYRAGVLEHHAWSTSSPDETIYGNLNAYRYYTEQAKMRSVDILVFPEYGLTSTNAILQLADHATEINENSNLTKKLATIAEENQIYLVVNLVEKSLEVNSKIKFYNTNVVFDRQGRIVFKYRKINLYQEPGLSPGDANQGLSFTTDFGVTFGIFTCFDILWKNPSSRVLQNEKVTDIIYPTAWIAIMPFYTPLSMQHGFSLSAGVNLLAANYNSPKNGFGGSGIYLASGKIKGSYINGNARSELLMQEVPKISRREDKAKCLTNVINTPSKFSGTREVYNIRAFFAYDDFVQKSDYMYENVDLSKEISTQEICHNKFCCTFNISVDTIRPVSPETYKLIAYDGPAVFFDFQSHILVCSLVVCANDSRKSCGSRVNSTVKFTKIEVKGNLEKKGWTFFRPVTLNYYLQPLEEATYCDSSRSKDSSSVQLVITKPQQNVIAFGIVGKVDSAASSGYTIGLFLVTVMYTVTCLLN